MIRRNQIVNLDDALDYILNRNTSQFESSDNLYSYEKENTDFDNTEPPPIIEINNKMRIVQTQIYDVHNYMEIHQSILYVIKNQKFING